MTRKQQFAMDFVENRRMKINHEIKISYTESTKSEFFLAEYKELIQEAVTFAEKAYAPYSSFRVSAVVLLKSGAIVRGTNVENASYPVGICAERNVLSHCISNYGGDVIRAIAIYADEDLGQPVPPCGLCRQSLLEAENRQKSPIQLILIAKNGRIFVLDSCADLLPLSFHAGFLRT